MEHPDFFEQLMPQNRELPDRQEMRHLEQVAGQMLLAGYEGPSTWLYLTTYYLANDQRMLEAATREVREAFESYDEITATSAAKLPYLAACLSESLRLMPLIPNGMPVVSPGATVDGHFIPKGVRRLHVYIRLCPLFPSSMLTVMRRLGGMPDQPYGTCSRWP